MSGVDPRVEALMRAIGTVNREEAARGLAAADAVDAAYADEVERTSSVADAVSGGEDRDDDERGVPCACLFDPDRQVEPVVECLYHRRLRTPDNPKEKP